MQTKRTVLSDEQKAQVKASWKAKKGKGGKTKEPDDDDDQANKHISEIEQAAKEFDEILQQAMVCDYVNIIHMVKVQRLGEAHINRAKAYNAKAKAEVTKQNRNDNDCKLKGIKNISRAIGGARAKPLTCVVRDRDTEDGGLKGQITTNPQEVDAVVKRAWQKIHNGMEGNIEKAVATFLSKYNEHIAKSPPFELPPPRCSHHIAILSADTRLSCSTGRMAAEGIEHDVLQGMWTHCRYAQQHRSRGPVAESHHQCPRSLPREGRCRDWTGDEL
jgi:hypothetical protein